MSADPQIVDNMRLPNTLALPAIAQRAALINNAEQLQQLEQTIGQAGQPLWVLGSGSNVVLPDRVPGTCALMRIMGIAEVPTATVGRRCFEVGAGESWQGFVRFCLGQGLGGGIENLSLIPGTMGAAPVQNIGAYGVEVAEFIEAVEVCDLQASGGSIRWLGAAECGFGYRDSLFKAQGNALVVTRVRVQIPPGGADASYLRIGYAGITDELQRMGCSKPTTAAVAEAVCRIRRAKLPDPRVHPNVGSFFKNPLLDELQYQQCLEKFPALQGIPSWRQADRIKLSAAALIDQAGWKRQPAATVTAWRKQPLVLVNKGGADSAAVLGYAKAICDSILERYGIELEQEPITVLG